MSDVSEMHKSVHHTIMLILIIHIFCHHSMCSAFTLQLLDWNTHWLANHQSYHFYSLSWVLTVWASSVAGHILMLRYLQKLPWGGRDVPLVIRLFRTLSTTCYMYEENRIKKTFYEGYRPKYIIFFHLEVILWDFCRQQTFMKG